MGDLNSDRLEPVVEWSGDPIQNRAHLERYVGAREQIWAQLVDNSCSLERIIRSHYAAASDLWVLGEHDRSMHENRVASWYRRWWYRLRSIDMGEVVELPLIGADRTAVIPAHREPLKGGRWAADLIRALFLQDEKSVDVLTTKVHMHFDPKSLSFAEIGLWTAMAVGDYAAVVPHCDAIRSHMDNLPDNDTGRRYRERFKPGWLSECTFAEAIESSSQESFSAAIYEAHNAHVKRYTGAGGPQASQSSVGLSMRGSAMVVLGGTVGLQPRPHSPLVFDTKAYLTGLDEIAPYLEPIS